MNTTWFVAEDGFATVNMEMGSHLKYVIVDWNTGECCEVLFAHYHGVEEESDTFKLW